MSLRLLLKQAAKRPSNALFYFRDEQKTGIAPTRLILDKQLEVTVGMLVTVNWDGEKVEAEILALADDVAALSAKDLEWSRENLSAGVEQELGDTKREKSIKPAVAPSKEKLKRTKKFVEGKDRENGAQHGDPYVQFLAEQHKRELQWKSAREAKRSKVQSAFQITPESKTINEDNIDGIEISSAEDSKKENNVKMIIKEVSRPIKIVESSDKSQEAITLLRQQLAARTEECRDLRLRLENMEAVTTRLLGNQMEMKDHFGKLLEKLQASVSKIEERMNERETNLNRERPRLGALEGQLSENHCSLLLEKLQASVSKIEERMTESETNLNREGRPGTLEGQLSENHVSLLESPVIPAWADETPSKVTESLQDIPDLTTIDFTTLNDLQEVNQGTPRVHQALSASQEVGEDLISQCVTPTRVKSIKTALSMPESERHLCALKLLPHFFSKEELAESNTDGSYEKQCLDSTRLNSLKVLVFSKFPLGANKDKEKAWKFVKGKINSKCRSTRKQLLTALTPKRFP